MKLRQRMLQGHPTLEIVRSATDEIAALDAKGDALALAAQQLVAYLAADRSEPPSPAAIAARVIAVIVAVDDWNNHQELAR